MRNYIYPFLPPDRDDATIDDGMDFLHEMDCGLDMSGEGEITDGKFFKTDETDHGQGRFKFFRIEN